jgi:hypothetical protein
MLSRLTLAACLVVLAAAPAVADDQLQAGVAVADITPPASWRMSGYFYERVSTGTKDPLHAKAVVFKQGNQACALVFCDLVGVPLQVTEPARAEASDATGIPVEHIAITATHSHTGPLFYGVLREYFHDRSVTRFGKDQNEPIDYAANLTEKLANVIEQAAASARPVQASAGFANENRVSFNRRYHMRDGSVRFNPGNLNPDIVRPAGPIDPQVGIVSLKAADGTEPFAALVEFPMHCDTTGGTEYSADYPHFLEQKLQEDFGKNLVVLFGAGTCGDINHIDVKAKTARKAEDIGPLLAEPVEQALKGDGLQPIKSPRLAAKSAKIETTLQTFSPSQIAKARQQMDLIESRDLPFMNAVEACKITALQAYPGTKYQLEVQAFRLSDDVAIVTLPSEIFVELGLAIKAASPFKTTIVIELANDSLGYIPTKKAFHEGSYEVTNSRVEAGTGELLADTAIKLLKELK